MKRRYTTSRSVVAAVVILIVGGLFFISRESPRTNGRPVAGPTASPTSSAEPAATPTAPAPVPVVGGRFAFIGLDKKFNPRLYLVEAAGGRPGLISDLAGTAGVSWSPNGSLIAFVQGVSEGKGRLWSVRANGQDPAIITTVGDPQYPSWSGDGGRIAFTTANGHLYVIEADGRSQSQITSPKTYCLDVHATWSPNGRRIAFDRSCSHGTAGGVYIVASGGGRPLRILSERPTLQGVAWSPDGRSIAFSLPSPKSAAGIYTMSPDGSGLNRLTDQLDFLPTWAPNGSAIAFVRNGRLWVIGAAGGSAHQIKGKSKLTVNQAAWGR
jgi:Tol biopolymer transport system component